MKNIIIFFISPRPATIKKYYNIFVADEKRKERTFVRPFFSSGF
jgi:hypothetical protein